MPKLEEAIKLRTQDSPDLTARFPSSSVNLHLATYLFPHRETDADSLPLVFDLVPFYSDLPSVADVIEGDNGGSITPNNGGVN